MLVTVTDNPDECPFEECESRKAKQPKTSEHGHDCPIIGPPDLCLCDLADCECHVQLNRDTAQEHRQILTYIKEIEDTYHELLEVVDDTVHLRKPVNHNLKIDAAIKDKGAQDMLKKYNSACFEFGLNNEK